MAASVHPPHRRSSPAVAALGALAFCLYALTGTGRSSFIDGFVIFATSRSLLDGATFAVPELPGAGMALKTARDGRSYAIYGPGLVFAHVPSLLLGRALPVLQPDTPDPARRDEFWAQLTNAWIMAVVVALIALSIAELGFALRTALFVGAVTAVASPLWLYARIDGTEALQALGLTGAAFFLFRLRRRISSSIAFAAGLMLAVAVAAKLVNLLVLPWFVGYASIVLPAGARRRGSIAMALPIAVVLVLVGVYDAVRFGDPFETGYVGHVGYPLLRGAIMLLILPSYGLLAFWPASLLAVSGALPFARRLPRETLLVAGVFATLLVAYSWWWTPWGETWGPRYLVPSVPLLALFLAPVVSASSRAGVAAVALATLIGLGVQLIAVAVSYTTQVMIVHQSVAMGHWHDRHRDPRLAPLRVGAWWLRAALEQHRDGPQGARVILRDPPWSGSHPWRWPARTMPKLESMIGLDLWVAPRSWRLPYRRFPPDPSPAPSSPELAVLLAVGLVLSAAAVARELHRSRSVGSPMVRDG